MNRILSTVGIIVVIAGLSGCHFNRGSCESDCFDCQAGNHGHAGAPCDGDFCQDGHNGNGRFGRNGGGGPGGPGAYAGPPSAAVTYPYYTTRGPRDFLAKDPRGIGP